MERAFAYPERPSTGLFKTVTKKPKLQKEKRGETPSHRDRKKGEEDLKKAPLGHLGDDRGDKRGPAFCEHLKKRGRKQTH